MLLMRYWLRMLMKRKTLNFNKKKKILMLVWIWNNLFQRIIKFNNLLLISHGNSNNYPKFKRFNTKQTIHLWMFFKLIRTKISKKMMGSVPLISLKMMVLRILRLNLTNKKKSLVTLLTFNKQNNSLHQHHKVS